MRVIQFVTVDGKVRYYLEDNNGLPVESVLKFLRFKDNIGFSRNTLRNYAYHLKLFFSYLEITKIEYTKVKVDDLAMFVSWLQNPWKNEGVLLFSGMESRQPQTINLIISTVTAFYDYLMRHEDYEGMISERLINYVNSPKSYRGMFYGIAKNKEVKRNILKLKEPQKVLKTVTKDKVIMLFDACTNGRDYFLLQLLFETGMRIGEALSLWIEDFEPSEQVINLIDRGELENQAEIKTVSSPRRLDTTQELMDSFMEYICTFHTEEADTNHVFIKLAGRKKGTPMDYSDVDNLFRSLRKKTEINVTPHMFRHTSLSLLYSAGWKPELLRIRAGHKSIQTTMDTYVHPSDEDVAEAFNSVKSVFSETDFPTEGESR